MAAIKEKTRTILVTSIVACLLEFGLGTLFPVPFSFQSPTYCPQASWSAAGRWERHSTWHSVKKHPIIFPTPHAGHSTGRFILPLFLVN